MGKREDREAAIRRLVDKGSSDEAIAEVLGIKKSTVASYRSVWGIRRNDASVPNPAPPLMPEPLIGETYTDADGLTVTRYPARFAGGTDPRITARGKRG